MIVSFQTGFKGPSEMVDPSRADPVKPVGYQMIK